MHLFLSLRAPRSERPRRSWSAAGVVSIRCLPYGQAVRTLAEGDVREVASVAAELTALDDAEPFPVAVLARLATLVGSRDATYTELDRGREAFLYEACWEDGVGGTSIRPEPDRPSDTLWWRLRHQHPIRAYRERTDDWTSTRLMSDFVSMREFRRTEIWNELYRDQQSNHWIGVGLRRSPAAQTRMFVFTRERRDFRDRDRLVLDLLQPHLQRRYERAQTAAEAADALATFTEHDNADTGRLIICSRGGTIEFASKQARRILGKYFESAAGRLPASVSSTLHRGDPVTVNRGEQRLTLRSTSSAGLLVVVLSEEDLRLKRLTPRQRTILEHVATGATDAQIAADLAISPATVSKHLEQIYERLEIHTRTAAAALLTA